MNAPVRCCLLFLLALGLARPARSQPGAAPAVLAGAARLEAARQYEAAFTLLDQADPKNQQPAVVLQKEHLLLNYYLVTLMLQGFGLRDLGPGETVAALRGAREGGSYSMHFFDIPQILTRLQKKFPQDAGLSLGLGDYYYKVTQCGCGERDKTPAQVQDLIIKHYEAVHARGPGTYRSHFALGYAHLARGQTAASVAPLRQALALDAAAPDAAYNLAYALLELKKPAEALPLAQTAYRLYADTTLRADAARMLGQLYQQQRQPAEARQALLQSLALEPRSYPSLLSLFAQAQASHAPDASAWATRLYQLNPANDQMFGDILDVYQAQGQWAEAEAFFRQQLPTAPAAPAAQGLLHLYLGTLNMQLKRPQTARPHFLTAQTQLAQVAPPDSPIFEVIAKGLRASQ